MNWHEFYLWFWFLICALAYVTKRAFYLIKGPNPVANTIPQFIAAAGIPVAFRLLADSMVFWICFTPAILQAGLQFFNWQMAAGVVAVVTKYAPCAGMFGLTVDPMMDWAIPTVIAKIPFLKEWWPQMPPPLKPVATPPQGGN